MCQMIAYKSLKTMTKICRRLKNGVAVGFVRWSFTRGSNRALTGKNLVFGQLVAYGRWSLTRGGRTWRFDCICPTKNYPGFQRLFLRGFRFRLKSPTVFIMTRAKNRSQALAASKKNFLVSRVTASLSFRECL